MGGPEEMSSKEHRTGASSGVGLVKQMVGEFVFCFPVMDHSFSTSMGFFLGGGVLFVSWQL